MSEEKKQEAPLPIDRQYVCYLRSEIDTSYRKYESLRKKNGQNAVVIRFMALILSAVVTIILGLNLEPSRVWNGIALTLSAMTGVVSGFSSFFDFNALSIKFKDTQDKLNLLRIKLDYIDLQDGSIDGKALDAIRDEYLEVLTETYSFYQSVKKEDSEEQKGKRFDEAQV